MTFAVCGGAVLKCPFGAAPSVLMIEPQNRVITAMPLANIIDNKPLVNILPFGMCSSLANPTVAAATAAAMGILTPMPCVPNIVGPWAPGASTVLIGNKPALNDISTCNCMWGGVITITKAGQTTIMAR